jgi:hypothetical protein
MERGEMFIMPRGGRGIGSRSFSFHFHSSIISCNQFIYITNFRRLSQEREGARRRMAALRAKEVGLAAEEAEELAPRPSKGAAGLKARPNKAEAAGGGESDEDRVVELFEAKERVRRLEMEVEAWKERYDSTSELVGFYERGGFFS